KIDALHSFKRAVALDDVFYRNCHHRLRLGVRRQSRRLGVHGFTNLLLGTYTSAVIPGTKRSPGLSINSFTCTVSMSRLGPPLISRWVAKSASDAFAITLPHTAAPEGITTRSQSPSSTASASVSGSGAYTQVSVRSTMVTIGAPAATTSPCLAARTFTFPLTGANTLE